MAFEIPSASALTFALSSNRAASRLASVGVTSLDPANGTSLSNGLVAGRFIQRSAQINTAEANTVLRRSLFAGHAIRDALVELAGLAAVAANEGLVSSGTALTIHGTRVSSGNIQTQINRALGLINQLVDATNVRGGSFIDGGSLPFKIQTSKYGGTITINPQGLDPFSLGISSLDVSTGANARISQQQLLNAAQTAGSRLDRLSQLQLALGQSNAFSQNFVTASASFSGAVPTGTLVNLSA